MDTEKMFQSVGFSASIPGAGHIRKGLPCQDASAVVTEPRPALIVCDGRGSASHSHFGAQAAVKAFKSQVAVFEPMMLSMLDTNEADPNRWSMFCRILYRTLMQVKLDLSAESVSTSPEPINEKEFDFTVACAVVGRKHIGCFQVGDGAIVLRQNEKCITAFEADKGEFANQTQFLREGGERRGKFHAGLFDATVNSGIAITSDGPEHLMFHLPDMIPGPVFDSMFRDLANGELIKQDIMDYLTRNAWNNDPRGSDDRSLAILYVQPEVKPEVKWEPEVEVKVEAEPEPEVEVKVEAKPEPEAEVKVEAKTEPEAEVKAEPEPEAEVKAEPEPEAELQTASEPEPDSDTTPEIKPEADSVSETASVPLPDPEPEQKKTHRKTVKKIVAVTTACLLACGSGIAGTATYCHYQHKVEVGKISEAYDAAIASTRKELASAKAEIDMLKSKLAEEMIRYTELKNASRKLQTQQCPGPQKGSDAVPDKKQLNGLKKSPISKDQTPCSQEKTKTEGKMK